MFNKINIKKIVLILVAVTIISFIGAGISVLLGGLREDTSMRTVDVEKVYAADELESIDVLTISRDINLYKSNGSDIKVHLHGETNIAEESAHLVSELKGKRLVVKIKRNEIISVGFAPVDRVQLDLYIPADFYKNINLKSTSGEITVEELNLSRLEMKTISGNIDGNRLLTKSSDLETTSGNMMLREFSGELKVKTISGNLYVDYKELNAGAHINTTSGDVELKLPEESALASVFETLSGNFTSNITLTKVGNVSSYGEKGSELRVKTLSGNYRLFKK